MSPSPDNPGIAQGDYEPGSALASLPFERLLSLLEETILKMSDPEVGIEEATDLYERAGALRRAAADRLDALHKRVDAISERWGEEEP